MTLQTRCHLGLQCLLPKWPIQTGFGCWQVILLSLHMGLSVGLLEWPHNTVVASPRGSNPGNQGRNRNPFYDLGFRHILLDTKNSSDSDLVWEETIQSMHTRRWGSTGNIWPPQHPSLLPSLFVSLFLCVGFVIRQTLPKQWQRWPTTSLGLHSWWHQWEERVSFPKVLAKVPRQTLIGQTCICLSLN